MQSASRNPFERLGQRGTVIAAVALVAVALIVGFLVLDGDGSGDDARRLTTEEGDAQATTESSAAVEATTTTDATGTNATATTSTTASSTASTTAAATPVPAADPGAPPVEPFGVYRDGHVTLRGSAPDEATASGYFRRAVSVLGEDNVTMAMTVDPRVQRDTMTIDIDERFRFPEGSVAFDPEFEALLNLGATVLQLLPETTLVITGHTDSTGSEATNVALSHARAQVVVDFMVGRGVPANRVVAVGAGESQPIAPNETPEGRAVNRRIEASLEGLAPLR
jgi:outer membrane protein OmpA-like peptidoglycan-associated protein